MKLRPCSPPSNWSCVDRTSTEPSGVLRACTLGPPDPGTHKPLLDDAVLVAEPLHERVVRQRGVVELDRVEPFAQPVGLVGRAGVGQAGEKHLSVPKPRDALVELHDGAFETRAPAPQFGERPQAVVFRREVAEPCRLRNALLIEQAPSAALRPEADESRVASVHRNAEPNGQVALEPCRVEGHQMRGGRIRDQAADPLDEVVVARAP